MQIIQLKSHLDVPFVNLQQLYEFEFSALTGYKVNSDGLFDQEYLRSTWSKSGVDIYVASVDGQLAGFAVVNLSSMLAKPDTRDIAEFFIMPDFRKQKIGTKFIQSIFAKYPGNWQVRQIPELDQVRSFWQKAILSMENVKDFHEEINPPGWQGFVQNFTCA